jgi:hypothetical protein
MVEFVEQVLLHKKRGAELEKREQSSHKRALNDKE